MDNKQAMINAKAKNVDGEDDLQFRHLVVHEQLTNWDGLKLVKYKVFYIPLIFLKKIIFFEKKFKARDEDIIVATYPKSGTTWLKALTFSRANRNTYDPIDSSHPLLSKNPHELVPNLEYGFSFDDAQQIIRTRIIGTHMAYHALPQTIRDSKCKIIYICRNHLDQFVSYYHFSHVNFAKNGESTLAMNEALDAFCEGVDFFGPIWDQVLSYWKAHVENPEKVLFLKYENLKDDTVRYVRKIAEFIGQPFSMEEERRGVPEKIKRLCSFESLSNLEVNKNGGNEVITFKSLYRKGEVGDWRNYLTPEMARRIQTITANKFEGAGLTF